MDSDSITSSQPDQYARDNCLSIDSHVDPISLALQINGSLPQPTVDVGPSGLTSDAHLPQLQLPAIDLREQLSITKESIDILSKALQRDNATLISGQYEIPLAQYERRQRLSKLKLELPALPTDPDFDCHELAKIVREQYLPRTSPGMFPSERLNENNDEGLGFPDVASQYDQKIDCIARQEKLDVPKAAIYSLASALQGESSDREISRELVQEIMPRRIFANDLAITPPLSPFMDDEEHFIPDIEVCKVPIASDPVSLLSDDLRVAQSAVLEKELAKAVSPICDLDILRLSPLVDLPTLGKEQPRIDSIKFESPLSPITSPLRSADEKPITPELLKSMDIDHRLSHPEPSQIDASLDDDQDISIEESFQAVIEKSAATVLKSIEQEHISIADAMARVEVPIMDFSIPEPEWQGLPMITSAHLEWLYNEYNIKIPPWPKDPRVNLKLRWIPFLKKIDCKALTMETIDHEVNVLQSLSHPDDDVLSSANYVWKRPGLAILRELELEEDLEDLEEILSSTYSICHLASLAKKRRPESPVAEIQMSRPSSSDSVDLVMPFQSKRPLKQTVSEITLGRPNLLPSLQSNSAVSALLSNYIDIHTTKRRKQDQSSFFLPVSKPETEPQPRPIPRPLRLDANNPSINDTQASGKNVTSQAPCPMTATSNTPIKFIKGLTLSRKLLSNLEQLCPTAVIIERDFDRWNTVAWGRHSVSRSPVVSSLAAEADVIASPTTGIIVTTLLKVIQTPLPGHVGHSSIRARIKCVALRYERLIVLVSEGNIVDETVRDLTGSEATAYTEFISFAASLNSKIEVFYVGGGETTLAKWLIFLIARHAPEAAGAGEYLAQDETRWEVFLRRAGFNVYAAQAVLARLRGSEHVYGAGVARCKYYDLSAFMMMTDAERLEHFRDLMGGEAVLNRVNRMLGTRWS
ncbi:hypothetical protein F4777DRAFT_541748 [Nemania sp. FL0916]|nr:hypothetical protein F4777DRAFT_541748 [Nemania sp. FL0916]